MATRINARRQGTRVSPSEAYFYGEISRGTSLIIPVTIKTPQDEPVNLTDLEVVFTIKQVRFDYDREDEFAYVAKEFYPQEPLDGRFQIELSSTDLDFSPGHYHFDIQLRHPDTGMVHRLVICEFRLTGAPTNRTINPGTGQLPIGNEITMIRLIESAPIVIIAPMMALSPSLYEPIANLQAETADLQARVQYLEDLIASLI